MEVIVVVLHSFPLPMPNVRFGNDIKRNLTNKVNLVYHIIRTCKGHVVQSDPTWAFVYFKARMNPPKANVKREGRNERVVVDEFLNNFERWLLNSVKAMEPESKWFSYNLSLINLVWRVIIQRTWRPHGNYIPTGNFEIPVNGPRCIFRRLGEKNFKEVSSLAWELGKWHHILKNTAQIFEISIGNRTTSSAIRD